MFGIPSGLFLRTIFVVFTGRVWNIIRYPVRRYAHDVDKTMVQLRFESEAGAPLGVINWYAVHATSMNNTNRLVSSDNVGYASVLFEQKMNPGSFVGKVSGFTKLRVFFFFSFCAYLQFFH